MTLMIDNFDSFTYNIVDILRRLGEEVIVKRNDEMTLVDIERMAPDRIVISPGPGDPDGAGICLEVVLRFAGSIPILGVCLGHQVIVQAFGGRITGAPTIMHGKQDRIAHDGRGLFRSISKELLAARYHSLIADPGSLPEELEVTARAQSDQTIMGVRHVSHTIEGVQFHPESIGTEYGMKMLENFLSYRRTGSPVREILQSIMRGEDLDGRQAYEIMDEITDGVLSDGQIGAFLGALSVKGVTPGELSEFARVLLAKTGVSPQHDREPLLDTCGTGGDGKHTFNISTAMALTCASAGQRVAKHGNKAVSSKSGSYDFLAELGIAVNQPMEESLEALDAVQFSFLFAPRYHGAMRHVGRVRQELGVRTVFNMIGPLVNPLRPEYQIAGVFSSELLAVYAETLHRLGTRRALVVHARDGLDEISVCSPTDAKYLQADGTVTDLVIDPAAFGIPGYSLEDLHGGNAAANVELFREILAGERTTMAQRAVRDAIALNAGAALWIAERAASIEEGFAAAGALLDHGGVAAHLKRMGVDIASVRGAK